VTNGLWLTNVLIPSLTHKRRYCKCSLISHKGHVVNDINWTVMYLYLL